MSEPTICRTRVVLAATLLAALGLSCATPAPDAPADTGASAATDGPPVGIDNLNAVLWVQTAVEYRATSLQAYALGRHALEDALADPGWSAAIEQADTDLAGLPPAIILDIDETVLDNSYYEARLVQEGQAYASETWDAWVEQRAATPIPGALEFLQDATGRGVTIFYVSNRRAHLEDATRANLTALGFPLEDDIDTLLLRGERPEWESSDKTPRRRHVAATHRILLMFGDNMGDFTDASDGTLAERAAFAQEHRGWWGTRWITLANPTYGSFLDAVLGDDASGSNARQVEVKKQALDPRR